MENKMKKNMILMSILAAALLAGCNDKDEDIIADGTLSCSVDADKEFVVIREDGIWKQKEACEGSCHDGACLSTHLTCSNTEATCVKDALDIGETSSLIKTCSNGEIKYTNCALSGKICGVNETTGNVACIDDPSVSDRDCVDGTYRCNIDGKRQFCSAGRWKDNGCASDKVCSAGECVDKPRVCYEKDKVCDGIVARTCSNNTWIDQTCDEATQACVNGECVSLPKEGDSCGDFKASCSNGNLYSCGFASTSSSTGIGYAVYIDECDDPANGTVCLNLSTGADCVWKNDSAAMKEVGPCKNAGDVFFAGCDGDYMDAVKCVEKDGVLYGQLTYPESICEGNTRISCANNQIVEESCIACNYSSAYEQAQCVTENGGNNAGNNGGGSSSGGNGGNGGSSSSGATCHMYDCSAEYLELCTETFGNVVEIALCDSDRPYCMITNSDACDAGSGYNQLYIDDSDNPATSESYCLVVGDDASCLGGGSSSGGSSEGEYYECGDLSNGSQTLAQICNASKPGSSAVCIDIQGGTYYECTNPCDTLNSEKTACDSYSDGDFQHPMVCAQVGSGKYYVDAAESESDYIECSNGCNAEGTACK